MKKEQIIRVIIWSTVALIIPIFGQLFLDGWNWGAEDFVAAWVFFNLLGITHTFVTNKFSHSKMKIVASVIVIAFFIFIWVILATG